MMNAYLIAFNALSSAGRERCLLVACLNSSDRLKSSSEADSTRKEVKHHDARSSYQASLNAVGLDSDKGTLELKKERNQD